MVKEIKNIEEFSQAINDGSVKFTIIDFYGKFCGPCRVIAPIFAEYEQHYPMVGFYKLDVSMPALQELAMACDVTTVPTFCFFRKNDYITKMVGADHNQLKAMMDQYLAALETSVDSKAAKKKSGP